MPYSFDESRARCDARGIDESVARTQFELIDQIIDASIRWAWGDDPVEDALGIDHLIDSKPVFKGVESKMSLSKPYKNAAQIRQEGKEHDSQNKAK